MDYASSSGPITSFELNDIPGKTEEEKKVDELEKIKEGYRQVEQDFEEEAEEQHRRKEKEARERKESEEQDPQQKEKKRVAIEQSLEKLQTETRKYDDGLVAGYKEDIDTLLVFAGLFSAVVTAFLIESDQWLSEDPKDTTVALLTQIYQQMNGSHPFSSQPETFTPEASSIRINCFWFLSLIFSLTSALFGLLCKQWLREYQRDVPTRTPAEALALRQLRRDSFEKWGVASFLSALPILLEVALLFFFVGVLDLLRTLHIIPFSLCLAAVTLSLGLYFLTTFLPTLTMPRDQASFIGGFDFGQLRYQFICPYKSPQAWAVYRLLTGIAQRLTELPFVARFIEIHFRALWDHIHAQASSWSVFDLHVLRQFDAGIFIPYTQVYELRAFQWAVTMFRDTPSMIPHLENMLETLAPSVAVSAVLGRWDVTMWEEVPKSDVGTYLTDTNFNMNWLNPVTTEPSLHTREGIELVFSHLYWNTLVKSLPPIFPVGSDLEELVFNRFEQSITRGNFKRSKNLRFYIPFPVLAAFWQHTDQRVRKRSLQLLQYIEESWSPYPGYDEEKHDEERLAFIHALAKDLNRTDRTSELLTSKRERAFIRFIHNEIISRRHYYYWYPWERSNWLDVIGSAQTVGELPPDYFAPLPARHEDPPASTQLPPLEPIQYETDTIYSQGRIMV